jgi:hypothetical protein
VCAACPCLTPLRGVQGAFLRALQRGRAGVRAALRKRPHAQAMQADVERLKLRGCPLPGRFLLREMVGAGVVSAARVPAGTMLRLVSLDG